MITRKGAVVLKRLIEIGKDILIVALLCSLLLLAVAAVPTETIRANPQLSRYLQPLAPILGLPEAELAYVETVLPVLDAAQPVVISAHHHTGRTTAMWDFDTLDAAFDTYGGLLAQAMDTADLFSAASEAQIRKALSGTNVYFRYHCSLPASLLASWLGAELNAALPETQTCILSAEGDVVALYFLGTPHYRAVTQVPPEDLVALVEKSRSDGSKMAFETDLDLSPTTLLPGTTVSVPAVATSNPCDNRYMDQLATDLGFNPYSDARFTDQNGVTHFSEANSALSISAAGEVLLTNADTARFQAASDSSDALVELARQLMETAVGNVCGSARIYLSGVKQQGNTTVCTFDYLVSGITVDLGGSAATVTFAGATVTEMQIRLLAFRLTGNTLYPLPVAQAAAILPPDSRLLLQYHSDGGSALTVGWMQ